MAAILKLVVLYMVLAAARIRAYEMVFSNQTIPDLAMGAIDVGKLITSDWLALPLGGSCGLATKYITPHVFNTSGARGTLHTTFEYLTQDCTAEFKHDLNMCAMLTANFAMCVGFPLDARTGHSPWGYCSNQNSRVSYLWIPENSTTTAMPLPPQQRSSDREQTNLLQVPPWLAPLFPSPPPPSPPPPSPPPPSPPPPSPPNPTSPLSPPPSSSPTVCLSHGLPNKTATNPEALAKLYKDHVTLSRITSRVQTLERMDSGGETMDTTLGRKVSRGEMMNFRDETLARPNSLIQPTDSHLQPLQTPSGTPSCDWSHSNIIPVAFDGVQNVLMAGQSLRSPDGTYALTMQYDCNLVLYKKRPDGSTEWNAKWASFSQFNDPFQRACYLEMQPDGNLVVKDPLGTPRWSSGGTAPSLYSTALSVISCGNVIVLDMTSGAIVWATHTGHS